MHILYRIDRTREDQADKTKMINNGVQRDEDGKWMIDPENAVVLQVTTHNRSLIGKDKQKTYPKAVMIGKCGGSLQVFQQGLLDGDIVAVMDGGQTFYKYRSMEVENRVSVENVLTKNQDHRLNDEEDAKLEKFSIASIRTSRSSMSSRVRTRLPTPAPPQAARLRFPSAAASSFWPFATLRVQLLRRPWIQLPESASRKLCPGSLP